MDALCMPMQHCGCCECQGKRCLVGHPGHSHRETFSFVWAALRPAPCAGGHQWGPYAPGHELADDTPCQCGAKTYGQAKAEHAERQSGGYRLRQALRGAE